MFREREETDIGTHTEKGGDRQTGTRRKGEKGDKETGRERRREKQSSPSGVFVVTGCAVLTIGCVRSFSGCPARDDAHQDVWRGVGQQSQQQHADM